MTRLLEILIGCTLLFWLAASKGADYWNLEDAYVLSGAAAVICLLPSTLTLAWSAAIDSKSPEKKLLVVLGSTAVRMFFVMSAGLALYYCAARFNNTVFWVWILVFYLFTLALEVTLLLWNQVPENKLEHANKEVGGMNGGEPV